MYYINMHVVRYPFAAMVCSIECNVSCPRSRTAGW